ncbi:hypothetical protein AAMO2058_000935800 [Amorphochlora amoebiformis]
MADNGDEDIHITEALNLSLSISESTRAPWKSLHSSRSRLKAKSETKNEEAKEKEHEKFVEQSLAGVVAEDTKLVKIYTNATIVREAKKKREGKGKGLDAKRLPWESFLTLTSKSTGSLRFSSMSSIDRREFAKSEKAFTLTIPEDCKDIVQMASRFKRVQKSIIHQCTCVARYVLDTSPKLISEIKKKIPYISDAMERTDVSKRLNHLYAYSDPKVGILGCGRIGYALAQTLLDDKVVPPSHLVISTRRPDTLQSFRDRGVTCIFDNSRLIIECALVFVCILPEQMHIASASMTQTLLNAARFQADLLDNQGTIPNPNFKAELQPSLVTTTLAGVGINTPDRPETPLQFTEEEQRRLRYPRKAKMTEGLSHYFSRRAKKMAAARPNSRAGKVGFPCGMFTQIFSISSATLLNKLSQLFRTPFTTRTALRPPVRVGMPSKETKERGIDLVKKRIMRTMAQMMILQERYVMQWTPEGNNNLDIDSIPKTPKAALGEEDSVEDSDSGIAMQGDRLQYKKKTGFWLDDLMEENNRTPSRSNQAKQRERRRSSNISSHDRPARRNTLDAKRRSIIQRKRYSLANRALAAAGRRNSMSLAEAQAAQLAALDAAVEEARRARCDEILWARVCSEDANRFFEIDEQPDEQPDDPLRP